MEVGCYLRMVEVTMDYPVSSRPAEAASAVTAEMPMAMDYAGWTWGRFHKNVWLI